MKSARIGSGVGYFIAGWVALSAGLFCGMAAAAGGAGAGVLAVVLLSLVGGFFAIGFWVSIAHRIELRLMDIEQALKAERSNSAPASTKTASEPAR